jgi:hypothetical protein
MLLPKYHMSRYYVNILDIVFPHNYLVTLNMQQT